MVTEYAAQKNWPDTGDGQGKKGARQGTVEKSMWKGSGETDWRTVFQKGRDVREGTDRTEGTSTERSNFEALWES